MQCCVNNPKIKKDVCVVSYRLAHIAVLDDTEGYFGIGGGKYIRGVAGFFGPVIYYRNRIPPHSMVMSCTGLQCILTLYKWSLIIFLLSRLRWLFQMLSGL